MLIRKNTWSFRAEYVNREWCAQITEECETLRARGSFMTLFCRVRVRLLNVSRLLENCENYVLRGILIKSRELAKNCENNARMVKFIS